MVVEVKRKLQGRDVDQLRAMAVEPYVVVAAYLSKMVREGLAAIDVSYGDATGNLRIALDEPGLFIEREGASKDPWREKEPLRTLKGAGTARALRAILDSTPPFGVRELADRTKVPLASLSRAIDVLDRDGLLTRGPKSEVLDVDWERSIRRWALDYDFARSNSVSYFLEPRGLPALTKKLSDAKWKYALTGTLGSQDLVSTVPTRLASLYVADVRAAAEKLDLRQADAGANVALAEPFSGVVFERRRRNAEGVWTVAATQLAVDLLTGPGRDPSEGEELLGWMRQNETAWRD